MFDKFDKIELVKNYWYNPRFLMTINIVAFLTIITSIGLNIGGIILALSLVLVISLLWYNDWKLPKNDEDSLGILLAVTNLESRDRDRFENDFVKVLKENVDNEYKNLRTKLYPLNSYRAEKINQDNVRDYLVKTNTNVCVYGTFKKGKIKGEEHFNFNIDIAVRHRRIPENLSKNFASEISDVFPRNIVMSVDDELVNFKALTEWLRIVILYCLIIAETISNNYSSAQMMLDKLSSIVNSSSLHLSAIEKIKNRLITRQIDIYVVKNLNIYNKWRIARSQRLFEEIRSNAKKALSINPNLKRFILHLALSEIVLNNNIDKAINLMLPIRGEEIVKLNLAFVLCLKNDFKRALEYYQDTDFDQISIDQLLQIESFSEWYINNYNKEEVYLILCLINIFGKGDFRRAKEDFNLFFKKISSASITVDDRTLKTIRERIE